MPGSPRPWINQAAITTNNGSATLLLAAGTAQSALLITNEDATATIRVRFDGTDATAGTGIVVAAGKAVYWGPGQVPSGKISAYATAAVSVSVAYIG